MMDTEISRVKSLLQTLALYIEARGRLLQIEAREAGSKFSVILIFALLLAGCLLFAWMIAVPALIFLVADSQGWPWWKVTLGAAGLHLFFACVFLVALKARLHRLGVFEETLNQFKYDRDWIGTPPPGP